MQSPFLFVYKQENHTKIHVIPMFKHDENTPNHLKNCHTFFFGRQNESFLSLFCDCIRTKHRSNFSLVQPRPNNYVRPIRQLELEKKSRKMHRIEEIVLCETVFFSIRNEWKPNWAKFEKKVQTHSLCLYAFRQTSIDSLLERDRTARTRQVNSVYLIHNWQPIARGFIEFWFGLRPGTIKKKKKIISYAVSRSSTLVWELHFGIESKIFHTLDLVIWPKWNVLKFKYATNDGVMERACLRVPAHSQKSKVNDSVEQWRANDAEFQLKSVLNRFRVTCFWTFPALSLSRQMDFLCAAIAQIAQKFEFSIILLCRALTQSFTTLRGIFLPCLSNHLIFHFNYYSTHSKFHHTGNIFSGFGDNAQDFVNSIIWF